MANAAFRPKIKFDLSASNADMARLEGGEPEAIVLPGVFRVPTRANVRSIRRTTAAITFSRGNPGRVRSASTWRRTAGKQVREHQHVFVLGFIAHVSPAAMVAILLAAARVATGRLNVTIVSGQIQTSVHAGGIAIALMRDQFIAIFDDDASGIPISKLFASAKASDARARDRSHILDLQP